MSEGTPRRKPITAGELLDKLEQDPAYIARMEKIERERQQARMKYWRAARPMLEELAEAGFGVDSLDVFINTNLNYKEAIPILLRWLPRIETRNVKSSIVRSLTIKWAKPAAAPPLIKEFYREDRDGLKWVIGNALSVVADDSVFEEIVNIAQDKRHREGRQMVVVALGNMKNPKAVDLLIKLLDDDEVAPYAIAGLRKLGAKAQKARPYLDRFFAHPDPWVRNQAKRAIAKMDKAKK